MMGANTFVGVNGFYDTSRLFNKWHSSGGLGLEYAANIAGDDAVDLNFNWYGNLFNRDVLINAFRNKGNSFDLEAGYSHALFDHAMDLRLKFVGYQFDIGDKVYGWRGGADLTTRDGVFTVRYEYGHDRIDGYYNTVGGFVNVGFQLENLLSGESPFVMPQPVFRSPRDLRRLLGLKVKRNWHQPTAVVMTRHTGGAVRGLTCDRTVAPFTLTDEAGGVFDNNTDFGPPFPFASLDPTKLVKVTLTFKNPLVAGLSFSVSVLDTANNLVYFRIFHRGRGRDHRNAYFGSYTEYILCYLPRPPTLQAALRLSLQVIQGTLPRMEFRLCALTSTSDRRVHTPRDSIEQRHVAYPSLRQDSYIVGGFFWLIRYLPI